MEELDEIIENATAAVDARYFHLPVAGGEPVYRERVYCYELYHQLRLNWPQGSQFTLNGEIDKRAHPIIRRNGIPDFLVHVPGIMEGNDCIIEVKSVGPSRAAIRQDLEKINLFRAEFGYARGIYLVFGEGAEEDVARIEAVANDLNQQGVSELWLHTAPGAAAYRAR